MFILCLLCVQKYCLKKLIYLNFKILLKTMLTIIWQCRVAINFQFVKNTISVKHNNAKCNKMRYACNQPGELNDPLTSFFHLWGLPLWLRWQSIHLQCRRPGFKPWVGKILWKMEWLPTPVFWPGEFHEQGSLVGYSPWGLKELDTTDHT